MAARYEVQIIVPDTGKPKFWGAYADRDRAESVAATLRKHGFFVQVRRVDGEPEHCSDRRRFVTWAVLCGFAKPERLTEAIVAEIAAEAKT